MSIGWGQAARGGPEMGFWPLAVFTFVYADFLSLFDVAVAILLGFGGAVTFILIGRIQRMIPTKNTKEAVRERVSRDGVKRKEERQKSIYVEAGSLLLPDGTGMFFVAAIGLIGNFGIGAWLLFRLVGDLTSSSSPSAVLAALVMLPFLGAAVGITQYFW